MQICNLQIVISLVEMYVGEWRGGRGMEWRGGEEMKEEGRRGKGHDIYF